MFLFFLDNYLSIICIASYIIPTSILGHNFEQLHKTLTKNFLGRTRSSIFLDYNTTGNVTMSLSNGCMSRYVSSPGAPTDTQSKRSAPSAAPGSVENRSGQELCSLPDKTTNTQRFDIYSQLFFLDFVYCY